MRRESINRTRYLHYFVVIGLSFVGRLGSIFFVYGDVVWLLTTVFVLAVGRRFFTVVCGGNVGVE